MSRKLRVLISLFCLPILAGSAIATTFNWTNDSPWSVFWSDALNWNPAGIPGPTDTALLNAPPERGPVLDRNLTVGHILGPRWNSLGDQDLDIIGGTVTVLGDWEFGDTSSGTSGINIHFDSNVIVENEMRHINGNAEIFIHDTASLTVRSRMQLALSGSAVLNMTEEPNVVVEGDFEAADSNDAWFQANIDGGSLTVGDSFVLGSGSGLIDISGGRIKATRLSVQAGSETSSSAINVSEDGSIYVGDTLVIGDGYGTAVLDISGGDVNTADLVLAADDGSGTLNMSGGLIVVRRTFKAGDDEDGTCTINLYGGTIECGLLVHMAEYSMNIDDGVLVIDGNVVAMIEDAVGSGYISPYGDKDEIMTDYNGINAGRTTVWAIPHLEVVPDVVGMTRTEAETAITSIGLAVGTVDEQYHNTAPAEEVINQDPNGGTTVPAAFPVNLVVSLGRPLVPDVVGQMENDAVAAIEAVDSLTTYVSYVFDEDVPAAVVMSQSPEGGTDVDVGTTVSLVVSLGLPIVPNVIGYSEAVAIVTIEGVDTLTAAVTYEYHNSMPAGLVSSQVPAPGATADIGSTVDLVISLGQPIVPNVVAQLEPAAVAAIEAVDNLSVSITYLYHSCPR